LTLIGMPRKRQTRIGSQRANTSAIARTSRTIIRMIGMSVITRPTPTSTTRVAPTVKAAVVITLPSVWNLSAVPAGEERFPLINYVLILLAAFNQLNRKFYFSQQVAHCGLLLQASID
jgi:hypothetical protein